MVTVVSAMSGRHWACILLIPVWGRYLQPTARRSNNLAGVDFNISDATKDNDSLERDTYILQMSQLQLVRLLEFFSMLALFSQIHLLTASLNSNIPL